jgi:hypothetical protein
MFQNIQETIYKIFGIHIETSECNLGTYYLVMILISGLHELV